MDSGFAAPIELQDLRRRLRDPESGNWLYQDKVDQVKSFDNFETIDWMEDTLREQKDREAKKRHKKYGISAKAEILAFAHNWAILALIGIVIGIIAGCLNIVTAWLSGIRMGRCKHDFYLNKTFCCWGKPEDDCSEWVRWSRYGSLNYLFYISTALVFSFLATRLVQVYAPFAAGSGISEIKCIVSGFVVRGFLGWSTLVIKSLGLPLAISSGLSVGKEGPSVHYAVCVGNSMAKLFPRYKNSAFKGREFLTAAAAAGVAVAFGSPMGGVLFSIEEISSVFQLSTMAKSYFCSLVAVATLRSMNPFRNGQLVMFEVTYDTNWHYFEIPFYVLIGLFGGFYGIIVSKYNKRVVAFRKRYLASHATKEVLILAFLTASFCYFNEFLKVDMAESMQTLFHECNDNFKSKICDTESKTGIVVLSLLFATIARSILTIFSYGCKVPAGIFVPSMAAGATFGRTLGILSENIQKSFAGSFIFSMCPSKGPCIIPGTYAFLGAAAALSGITDLTITVVIIMFELTGAIRYMVPTMIVIAVTKMINDKFGQGGIADQMIIFNGLPLIESDEHYASDESVVYAMSAEVVSFSVEAKEMPSLQMIRDLLDKHEYGGFPIIKSNKEPYLLGYVSREKLEMILNNTGDINNDMRLCNFGSENIDDNVNIPLEGLVDQHPFILDIQSNLQFIQEIFLKIGPRYILIEEERKLKGILTRKDILRYKFTLHSLLEPDDQRKTDQKNLDAFIWKKILSIFDATRRFPNFLLEKIRGV